MDAALTFAHLSDPHLTSPAGVGIGDLLGKRALGYLSWRLRRRHRHRAHVLAALQRDLELTRPDHVVVTGDLTTLGLPAELDEARRWLEGLGPPARLTVVPGNHDAYAGSAAADLIARWQPYVAGAFPSVGVRGPAAFIGLSSARPSAPLLAVGTVGEAQRRRLATALADARARGLFRVVSIHHPVLHGSVPWRKRLTDAGPLRDILRREGAELVVHGHGHRLALGRLDGGAVAIPVIGVPSASALGGDHERAARYHLYRLTGAAGRWALSLDVRAYSQVDDRFVALGPSRLVRAAEPS